MAGFDELNKQINNRIKKYQLNYMKIQLAPENIMKYLN